MFLEGSLAREGFPLPSNSPPFPQRALLERRSPSHKKRSDECPADPPSGSSHPSTEGLQQEPLRFHFSYHSDSFALPAGGPTTGHGHHATPAAIHPDKMRLGRGGGPGEGRPFLHGGRLSNELHRKQDTLFPQLLDSRKITELLSWAVVYESHRPCYLFIGQPGKIPPSGKELPQ